ncbi:MAG: choice-of-anchor D domain-containing protein, partial [Verrucomicrobia bacterium]|nr:choice-of-anchor D domain-containing protein [Verrucomicrobiota bacterium]
MRNPGSADLTGLGLTIDGANPGDFTVTASPTAPLAPAGSTTFTVRFAPTALGARTAALHLASNDADENPFDIALSGTAVTPVPEIAVEYPAGTNLVDGTSTVAFGTVIIAANATRSFTVRNSGLANLTGLGITIDGTNAADFTVTANPTATVAPAGSTTFTVQFTPSVLGVRTANLHLASNDADENPFDIALSGTGIDARGTIALFANSTYVDITTEELNTQTSLQNLGFVVVPFTGITDADWNTAFASDVVVIPELETSSLTLSAAAMAAINTQLAAGKGLVIMGSTGSNEETLLNALRGWSLANSGLLTTGTLPKVAGASGFTNSPAVLTVQDATFMVTSASLPA